MRTSTTPSSSRRNRAVPAISGSDVRAVPYIVATRRASGMRVLLLLAEVLPDILRVRVVVAINSSGLGQTDIACPAITLHGHTVRAHPTIIHVARRGHSRRLGSLVSPRRERTAASIRLSAHVLVGHRALMPKLLVAKIEYGLHHA